jgi:hypothetical protein
MILTIDSINFIVEYQGTPSDYWLKTNTIIDIEDLESSHSRYLEIGRIEFPTYSDKLTTTDQFKERITQYYHRKERGIRYYLDIITTGTKLTLQDKVNKLSVNKVKVVKKNVGVQLDLF